MLHVNGLALSDPNYVGRRASLFLILGDGLAVELDPAEVELAKDRVRNNNYNEEEDDDKDFAGEEDKGDLSSSSSSSNHLLNLQVLQHLGSASVPALSPRTSFALRTVGAGRFADIWLGVKQRAQEGKR